MHDGGRRSVYSKGNSSYRLGYFLASFTIYDLRRDAVGTPASSARDQAAHDKTLPAVVLPELLIPISGLPCLPLSQNLFPHYRFDKRATRLGSGCV